MVVTIKLDEKSFFHTLKNEIFRNYRYRIQRVTEAEGGLIVRNQKQAKQRLAIVLQICVALHCERAANEGLIIHQHGAFRYYFT